MSNDAGHAGVRRGLEHVRVDAAKSLPGRFSRKDRNRAVPEHDGPRVVEAEAVVRVRVREQNGGDLLKTRAQGLLAEIRRSVNEDVMTVMPYKRGSAQPLVAPVIGKTGFAIAAHSRDADRCARAEQCDLHCFLENPTYCM